MSIEEEMYGRKYIKQAAVVLASGR